MISRPPIRPAWFLVVCLVLLGIYLPGLGNDLIFDDQRLLDGTIFGAYGSVVELKQRLISYGSFVWLSGLGAGWPAQRLVNLALHAGVVASLVMLVRQLMSAVDWPDAEAAPGHDAGLKARSLEAAAMLGVTVFALNPVAVYGVAYLIQRSIVMATLFSVLCLLFAVLGATRRWHFLIAAAVCYVVALLSKEHAVMLPVVALAAWLIVRRPPRRVVAMAVAGTLALCLLGGAFLLARYGAIVGQAFDASSQAYVAQLEALAPGAAARVHALSVVNQAWLFFKYGFLWLVPNILWLSLDLRPPFPLSPGGFPHVLGPVLYLGVLAGAVVMMLRYRDWRRFVGFGLFAPATLFATEFAMVWIQDPFVLYRGYLWAIGLPFLVSAAFAGARPRTILIVGVLTCLTLAPLAVERVQSLRNEYVAWLDAAAKVDLRAEPNAIGRWRPVMNRGNQYAARGMLDEALADYTLASRLGDPTGLADYHRGVALKRLGRAPEALAALTAASQARAIPPDFGGLPLLEKGELLFGMGRHAEAVPALDAALGRLGDAESRIRALKVRAQANIRRGETAVAVADYRQALEARPGDRATRIGYALALNADRQVDKALAELAAMAGDDQWDVHFARAMIFDANGRTREAREEIDLARKLNPDEPRVRQLAQKLNP